MPSDAMPSSLRDETFRRHDPLEREAQVIHLLCLNNDMVRRGMPRHEEQLAFENHIAAIAERLRKLVKHPPAPHLIEKA